MLITRFMSEAVEADRVIIMDRGKILLDGTPKEVFLQKELLREASLNVPMAVELADKLRARGIEVPEDVITREDMIGYLCQFK